MSDEFSALKQARQPDGTIHLYYGTAHGAAVDFLNGMPLDISKLDKIDGEPGFYLASHNVDAEYFAYRRLRGGMLLYILTDTAFAQLKSVGSFFRKIPFGGGFHPAGYELMIPPGAFSTFNGLRDGGLIRVTPA